MEDHTEAMVKSLIAVAWADGRMADEEHQVLEALISAFRLSPEDAEQIRTYANTKRTLADVPLSELSADDRRVLLQHAVILSYVDGEQCDKERALLQELVGVLRLPEAEAQEILSAAERRAQRLLQLL